jgi:hypothetical protein
MWIARWRTVALAVLMVAIAPAACEAESNTSRLAVTDTVVRESDSGYVTATVAFRYNALLLGPKGFYVHTLERPRGQQDFEPLAYTVVVSPSLTVLSHEIRVSVRILGDVYPEEPELVRVELLAGDEYAIARIWIVDTPDAAQPAGRTATTTTKIPQQLLSRTPGGSLPNAPATDPVLSWDARDTRYGAYTSTATNIAGQTDGHRNVFLVKRGGQPGKFGTAWEFGSTALASRAIGGAPANGDSWGPALGGWVHRDTAMGSVCMAFVSRASNLVRADRNGRADVFYRTAAGGRLRQLASPHGRSAAETSVSGDCRTIAMAAGGALYVARRGTRVLRKLARGGVSSPRLSYNGAGVSFARDGKVYTLRIGDRPRLVGTGTQPTADAGHAGSNGTGRIRRIAYQRGGAVYMRQIGGDERSVGAGASPSMTAGGAQTFFAHGPFVYLYASSNNFGKQNPQGLCPLGQGYVSRANTSARGNYVAFSCTGGAIFLSYIGPK